MGKKETNRKRKQKEKIEKPEVQNPKKKRKIIEKTQDEKIDKDELLYMTKGKENEPTVQENPIDLTKEDPNKGLQTKGRFFHDKSEEINELAKQPLLVYSNKKEFNAVCSNCGEVNHFAYNCPNSICGHCQNPGHHSKVFFLKKLKKKGLSI
jgi:hypothetical protein